MDELYTWILTNLGAPGIAVAFVSSIVFFWRRSERREDRAVAAINNNTAALNTIATEMRIRNERDAQFLQAFASLIQQPQGGGR